MDWTEEMVARLRHLWSEGRTGSEIAHVLGVSRYAVIGKKHRLKLEDRPSPIIRDGVVRPKRARAPRPAGKVTLPQAAVAAVSATPAHVPAPVRPISYATKCQWVHGEPGTGQAWHYCDAPSAAGGSWCEGHRRRVFVRTAPPPADAGERFAAIKLAQTVEARARAAEIRERAGL